MHSRSSQSKVIINVDALVDNYKLLCQKADASEVGAVVKENAYGLGMYAVAKVLYATGCRTFFTAHFSEALALRAQVRDATIVVMHGVDEGDYEQAVEESITPMLNHFEAIEAWHAFAKQKETPVPVIIHLDTGMNRLGLSQLEQKRLTVDQSILEGLTIKAWASHLACADEFNNPMTTEQRDRFIKTLHHLPPAPKSLCASSGVFWGADYHFDLIRPGIALYGGNPTPHSPNPMRDVIEIQAPILQVRDVDAEMTVGYGAAHRIKVKGSIATVAMGYADGYHRALSDKGTVMIGKHAAPVVGRISMDLITIDVTNIPESAAHVGATVTLIGPHRPIDQVAVEAGTIPYEILTSLGDRVIRDYCGEAKDIMENCAA